jgi:integrase
MQAEQVQAVVADVYQQLTGDPMEAVTVRGYFNGWLERRKPEVAHTSFLFYKMVVRDFLAWAGKRAENDLRTVTRKDILAYRNATAARVSARSTNHNLKTVRTVFKSARRDGLLVENPAEFVDTLPQERSERRPFTEAELRALLSVADGEWRSLILFGLYTGQRLGDLARLTWQNLDLQRGEVRLVTGKTGRRQLIPMHAALRRHVDTLPAGDDPHAPLHPHAFDVVARQNKSGTLSRSFRELLAQAGLAKPEKHTKTGDGDAFRGRRRKSEISFHSLRYTVTSLLQSAGVGQAVSQEIVGHDSEAIHAVYTRINRDTLAGAIATLPDVTAAADAMATAHTTAAADAKNVLPASI